MLCHTNTINNDDGLELSNIRSIGVDSNNNLILGIIHHLLIHELDQIQYLSNSFIKSN